LILCFYSNGPVRIRPKNIEYDGNIPHATHRRSILIFEEISRQAKQIPQNEEHPKTGILNMATSKINKAAEKITVAIIRNKVTLLTPFVSLLLF
jgi:hypothetical protein